MTYWSPNDVLSNNHKNFTSETMQNRSRLLVLNIGERIRFYDVATIVRTLLLAVFFL